MQHRFLLLAAAPVAIVSPAWATSYLTVPQVQALLFPHQQLAEDFRTLTPDQAKAIRGKTGVNVLSKQVKLWKAPNGGALIVDEVVGKHEFITYALALDPGGAVRDVEIMEYKETYGGQVRDPAWRQQFVGKRDGAPLTLGQDIRNNSGGTLSARHITDGVKRLLATYAIVYGDGHA
jgi:hypothetical protein